MDSFSFHDKPVKCTQFRERCKGCKHAELHERTVYCIGTTCARFCDSEGKGSVLKAECLEPSLESIVEPLIKA